MRMNVKRKGFENFCFQVVAQSFGGVRKAMKMKGMLGPLLVRF
jgi:hypothetical protein